MTPRTGILACAVLLSLCRGAAAADDASAFEVARIGDLDMDCYQISREISAMELLVAQAVEEQESTKMTSTSVAVAKTVGSYLVGTLAGGLGILAAGYIVSEATDDREENAIALQNGAEQRRSFMAGIYNARGCNGPLALAAIQPAAGEEQDDTPQFRPRFQYND